MGRRAVTQLWIRRGLGGLFVAVLAIGMMATPAFAARPTAPGNGGNGGGGGSKGGGGGGGGGTSTPTGNDVSYPQCGGSLPSSPAFAIVGVNGGLANDPNPCLQAELSWAVNSSTGDTSQPKAELYVNTADPGPIVTDWPTTSLSVDPFQGGCDGTSTQACAWQYGYNMATQDVSWLNVAATSLSAAPQSASGYHWWLDVETANTWQSGTAGQAMNVADLEGMVAALGAASVSAIGVYSTSSQWSTITGGTSNMPGTTLDGLNDWIPGARNLSQAESNCSQAPFTGGGAVVAITQWFAKPVDADYAC